MVWNTLIDIAKIDTSAVFRTTEDADSSLVRNNYNVVDFPPPIKTAYALNDQQLTLNRGAKLYRPCYVKDRKLGMDTSEMQAELERTVCDLTNG